MRPRRGFANLGGGHHGGATRAGSAGAGSRSGWPRETFDIAVIGGGVTGAGAALDAATRGLSVALVEQRDWAAGTSSRSSKLIHGGLRYLEQLDFSLVREALHEQTLMLERLCPHLVRPMPFLFPLARHASGSAPTWAPGSLLYDLIAGRRALPRHRHQSRTQARWPGFRASSATR